MICYIIAKMTRQKLNEHTIVQKELKHDDIKDKVQV